jgi:hypothetical protein
MQPSPDLYAQYKPLRNLMRTFSMESSLVVIWQCAQYLASSGPWPAIRGADNVDLRGGLFPYQLMLLCREILLHAEPWGTRTLANGKDFVAAHTAVNRYFN